MEREDYLKLEEHSRLATTTTIRTLVLMYHAIGADTLDSYAVSRSIFAAQLDAISETVARGSGDPHVVVTFDDGLISHYDIVLCELTMRDMLGLFFVPPGLIGKRGFLGWEHVRDLLQAGMVIGSHTVSHANLALIPGEEAFTEMVESKAILEDQLGINIHDIALPGGFAPREVERLAALAGYSRVFTSAPYTWNGHSMCVPRVCMRECVSPAELQKLITDGSSHYVRRERLKYAIRTVVGQKLYAKLYGMLRQ